MSAMHFISNQDIFQRDEIFSRYRTESSNILLKKDTHKYTVLCLFEKYFTSLLTKIIQMLI